MKLLSKSRYLSGLQCPRLIWVQVNEPGGIPDIDPVTQHVFDQGHLVGELAKKLFPGGIDLPQKKFMENITRTLDLLKNRKPLFEAGILAGNLYSRVDILYPANENEWDIIEVKSSTSLKNVHINDLAFQRYCCNQSGLNIRKCCLILINNQYVRDGEIDPEGLFKINDITDRVEAVSIGIKDKVDGIIEVISQETCPEMIIGPHCRNPYICQITDCWDSLPENNIFTLYYGGKQSFEMYGRGIAAIGEIPDDYKLSVKQRIQQACIASGEPHLDREAINDFLSSLEYPLYYFDFETIGSALPLFDGVRPYQNIPFQFSIHLVKDESSQLEHFSLLANDSADPRPALLAELKKTLGNSGSIITYNQRFEEGILREIAAAFPEDSDWIERVCNRLVDLWVPFRNFDYYHPAQHGSTSLKAVLPAITGKGYEDLGINDGQIASISFLEATCEDLPEAERAQVMENLESYCGRDTEGMIWIVEKLKSLSD